MKRLIILPLMGLFFSSNAQQAGQCGMSTADQAEYTDRLKSNIAYAEKNDLPENAVMYVPVHFHLTATTAGTGRPTMLDVFNALCTMNNDYAEHDIQFYLSPHPTLGLVDNSINNDNVYNNQTNNFLMNFKRHPNAINYYVVGTAQTSNNQPGGAAAYYSPARDWVVVNRSYTAPGDNTLSHETGHFFSLRHTFYGWESDAEDWENQPPCFDAGDPGWPCAPSTYSGFAPGIIVEKVDGSNCTVAADLICDTPPDYNFGYCQNGCGAYTGGAQDPMCQAVNPMENNFMSYFFDCADYEFTQGQVDVMKADLMSPDRIFLNNNFTPAALSFTTPNDLLVSPAEGEITHTGTSVNLTWNAVPGATYYYLEIDRTIGFGSSLGQTFVVQGTSQLVNDLTLDKKYYWRVRPFNEYYVCAQPKLRTFTVGEVSGTDNPIEAVNNWTLAPNPVSSNQPSYLQITAEYDLKVNIRVADVTGRIVYAQNNVQVTVGDNQVALPTNQLSKGLYLVYLEHPTGTEVKRLAVE